MKVSRKLYKTAQKVETISFGIMGIIAMLAQEFTIWFWLTIGVVLIPLFIACIIQNIYEDEHCCYPLERSANGTHSRAV